VTARNGALAILLAWVACAACGGAKAPPPKTPDAAAKTTPEAAPEKEDEARAAPAGKVESFAVVPHPARSIARLRGLLRGAPAAMPVLDRAMSWAHNVDLEQPIYTVFAEGSSATAVGLTPEIAKATRESAQTDCDVVDAPGGAGTRFVCPRGPGGGDLKALAAAAPPDTPNDAHLEIDANALTRFAVAGGGAAAALERVALGSELRSVSADLALDGPAQLKLALMLNPKGTWSSAALAAPVAAPPSTFARLPADAELALFLHTPAAGDQGPFKKTILDAIMSKPGAECTAAESDEARAHFEKVLFTGGSVAISVGFDRAAAETAADALVKTPTDKRKQTAMRAAQAPWVVLGFEEPSAKWLENVPWLAKAHCAKDKKPSKVAVTTKPQPRLGLPAGAIEIVERLTKDGVPVTEYTFVVPDKSGGPERTWIGHGYDEGAVATRLRAAAKGDADGTLAKRSGVAALREPATVAGFLTSAGAAWLLGDTNDGAALVHTASGILRSRSLPTGGRSPILFRAETARADGKIVARVALDAAAIGDVASVIDL
jgi:hypothetical protein